MNFLQIGLMRNGQLLAEETPSQLMIKHNCSTLEQAFLELSKKQHTTTIGQEDENCVSIVFIIISLFLETLPHLGFNYLKFCAANIYCIFNIRRT